MEEETKWKQQPKSTKEMLTKSKSQDEPSEEKANSIFIARQIINGDPSQYHKRLFEFKNLKNQNYQKFSERIQQNLNKSSISFKQSHLIFTEINHAASDENTTGHQMGCILEGFFRFWKRCQTSFESMQVFFNFICEVYPHIAKKYISVCKELIITLLYKDFSYFKSEAAKLIGKFYRGSKLEEDKILPLVHEFDLYESFGNAKVVEIAMRSSNANDIAFIFKEDDGNLRLDLIKLFIDKCTQRESKDDLKKCETIIKLLKLDPYQYPNMIDKMIGRYVNYQLRSNKLYFIQLVVLYEKQLIDALARQLIKENREREAKYFIVRYGLNIKYYGQISQKERERLLNIRNILIDNDYFGPTEIEVLQQQPSQQKKVLYMRNLGFDESNVTFVDASNISEINIEEAFSSKVIGMDTETTGGTHVFDQSLMTILQIFTGKHIFIFDYLNLTNNKFLKTIIKHIFMHCKIYGHDHHKEITSIQKQLDLDIDQKIMQELQRNRLVDTNKFFKKVYPKETKSNLVYITEFLLNFTVSKYEQCSGWRNRPLRKAQLHYASIDCILPLVLGEKLEAIQKQK